VGVSAPNQTLHPTRPAERICEADWASPLACGVVAGQVS